MNRPRVLIVTPAAAKANNGNWQTASRWAAFLSSGFDVTVSQGWTDEPFDVMLALHALKSAGVVAAWAREHGALLDAPGLGLILTGTDLYRDIASDEAAQRSLKLAGALIVLQEKGMDQVPARYRPKTRLIFQSTARRQTLPKTSQNLRVVMVGHLRNEKSPETLFHAACLLKGQADIFIDHIGEPLDADLGRQARETQASCPNYRWLGGLPHETTRRRIQRAHLLVHASKMEGGAHVVMEAVQSGTPVLASRIDGNVGMLGPSYAGYFKHGDARGLSDLLTRCRASQLAPPNSRSGGFLNRLQQQCGRRAPLFEPAREQAALVRLVEDLLKQTGQSPTRR